MAQNCSICRNWIPEYRDCVGRLVDPPTSGTCISGCGITRSDFGADCAKFERRVYQKPRVHTILFQPRFAELVEKGLKWQTVRPVRKRAIRKSDTLSLRKWAGLPYRSQQIVISSEVCSEVSSVELFRHSDGRLRFKLAGKGYNKTGLQNFAKADGFDGWQEFVDWIEETHGLPFTGIVIHWDIPF